MYRIAPGEYEKCRILRTGPGACNKATHDVLMGLYDSDITAYTSVSHWDLYSIARNLSI